MNTHSFRCAHDHNSEARQSTSVLYVEHWFRRLKAYATQSPLLQEALDNLGDYHHPWQNNQDLHDWGSQKYGTEWKFDPLMHHTSELLEEIRNEDPDLADKMQKLWAGDASEGTKFSSYRNRARELARICGETLDNKPGSIDMQLIERADENDGFQILSLMRKSTLLFVKAAASADFVDQDKELHKIQHKFVTFGVHTYIAAYRRQLRLFVEMDLPFSLPEQYNCQRIIAHLSTRCEEFKKCAEDFADAVRDKKATYTYTMVEQRFVQCETRHRLGPKNHGTPISKPKLSPPAQALLIKDADGGKRKATARDQKRKTGSYPKGSCKIHPDSTTHTTDMCYVNTKRKEFVHPATGVKGLSQAQCCPKHPKGWHPPDLCGDPRYMPSSRRQKNNSDNKSMTAMISLVQTQQQQMAALQANVHQNQIMMARGGQQLVSVLQNHPSLQPQYAAQYQPQNNYAPPPMPLTQYQHMPPPPLPTAVSNAVIQQQPRQHCAQALLTLQQQSPSGAPSTLTQPRQLIYKGGKLTHVSSQIDSARL